MHLSPNGCIAKEAAFKHVKLHQEGGGGELLFTKKFKAFQVDTIIPYEEHAGGQGVIDISIANMHLQLFVLKTAKAWTSWKQQFP